MRFLLFLIAALAQADSSIYVNNAASGSSQIAPGSLAQISWFTTGNIGRFPPAASVTIESQNRLYTAKVLSSSTLFLVTAVIPDDVAPGPANLTLTVNSVALQSTTVNIVLASIGIFTAPTTGFFGFFAGPAAAQNISSGGFAERNALTTPALPGQYVTLWGTGLGASKTTDVQVSIAGEIISPAYAGRAPGLPGVDQINFRVPADAPWNCYVPILVTAAGTASNPVTIAVNPATGSCTHPFGLFVDELRTLDSGGTVLMGSATFSSGIFSPDRSVLTYTRQEGFTANFLTEDSLGAYFLSLNLETAGDLGCIVSQSLPGVTVAVIFGALTVPSPPLAGSSLHLASANRAFDVPLGTIPAFGGSGGAVAGAYVLTYPLPPAVPSVAALPPARFDAGIWHISAPGGDPIRAFDFSYRLPPQIRWTNRDSLASFGRDADIEIVWDPKGYSLNDSVLASLFTGGGAHIDCRASAASGRIVMPAALLRQLGASVSTDLSPLPVGSLSLIFQPALPIVSRVDLKDGRSAPVVLRYNFYDTLRPVVK